MGLWPHHAVPFAAELLMSCSAGEAPVNESPIAIQLLAPGLGFPLDIGERGDSAPSETLAAEDCRDGHSDRWFDSCKFRGTSGFEL